MTTITTRFDDAIVLTDDEARVLSDVQALLRQNSSGFRQAFISELTDEFCPLCGSTFRPCYCGRDY